MKCKKCNSAIDADSIYCKWCGVAQKRDHKKKLYLRPDGLYEKMIILDGTRTAFRAKSEAEVYKKIAAYEVKQELGRTFSAVADEWEEQHFPLLSPNSLKGYGVALRTALDFFGSRYIAQIEHKDVQAYVSKIVGRGFAAKTVKNYFLVLSLIFNYAIAAGDLPHSPCAYIKLPPGLKKTKREAPTDDEIKIIRNSIDVPFGLFAFFTLYTGCRLGEALAVTGGDIDFTRNTLSINKSIYYEGSTPKVKKPKTASGVREIILPDVLVQHIPHIAKNKRLFGELSSNQFNKLWDAYRTNTGLRLTPHQLRHGYATLLYEAGVDVKEAQYLLGHANMATTMDIYTHLSQSQKIKTFGKFNEYTKNTQ